VPLSWTHTS